MPSGESLFGLLELRSSVVCISGNGISQNTSPSKEPLFVRVQRGELKHLIELLSRDPTGVNACDEVRCMQLVWRHAGSRSL